MAAPFTDVIDIVCSPAGKLNLHSIRKTFYGKRIALIFLTDYNKIFRPIVTSSDRINRWPLRTVSDSRPICLFCPDSGYEMGVSQLSKVLSEREVVL